MTDFFHGVTSEVSAGVLAKNGYRVRELLGQNGHGEIFLCADDTGHLSVAVPAVVKLNRHGQLGNRLRKRLLRMQDLKHPRLGTTLDVLSLLPWTGPPGDEADRGSTRRHVLCLIVSKWIPGKSLSELLAAGNIPPEHLNSVARSLKQLVQLLHTNALVHGDISMNNILVDERTWAAGLIDLSLGARTSERGTPGARHWLRRYGISSAHGDRVAVRKIIARVANGVDTAKDDITTAGVTLRADSSKTSRADPLRRRHHPQGTQKYLEAPRRRPPAAVFLGLPALVAVLTFSGLVHISNASGAADGANTRADMLVENAPLPGETSAVKASRPAYTQHLFAAAETLTRNRVHALWLHDYEALMQVYAPEASGLQSDLEALSAQDGSHLSSTTAPEVQVLSMRLAGPDRVAIAYSVASHEDTAELKLVRSTNEVGFVVANVTPG